MINRGDIQLRQVQIDFLARPNRVQLRYQDEIHDLTTRISTSDPYNRQPPMQRVPAFGHLFRQAEGSDRGGRGAPPKQRGRTSRVVREVALLRAC